MFYILFSGSNVAQILVEESKKKLKKYRRQSHRLDPPSYPPQSDQAEGMSSHQRRFLCALMIVQCMSLKAITACHSLLFCVCLENIF